MKRLLRISFNSAIFSLIPILSWLILVLLVDKNLVNVFTLTYPLQFIWALMKSIFATGANISKEKDKNNNAVLSGMTLGIIAGFIIFGMFAINVKKYIEYDGLGVPQPLLAAPARQRCQVRRELSPRLPSGAVPTRAAASCTSTPPTAACTAGIIPSP